MKQPASNNQGRAAANAGFTLIELLVVMVIIGILASITLPALKGIGQSNLNAAATRQILDDLAFARLRAMNERSTVYMVFVPPTMQTRLAAEAGNSSDLRLLTNLFGGQFTRYALLSARSVGDQPGQARPRYLTDWKVLPDGIMFAPYQFNFSPSAQGNPNEYSRPLPYKEFPFPDRDSKLFPLPYIGFNAQGQLLSQRDELLVLARGTVFYALDPQGGYRLTAPDVQLTPPPRPNAPPQTQTNSYMFVRINWLTGRAQMDPATTPNLK